LAGESHLARNVGHVHLFGGKTRGSGDSVPHALDGTVGSSRAFRLLCPVYQGRAGEASSAMEAGAGWIGAAALSWDGFLRKKFCIVSERFFNKCQRSAICLALGGPCLAPFA
jgi:hypothetical protein